MTVSNQRIQSILVFGGGSAGFLAAVTLKRWLRNLDVTVLRSKDIGIIGVGEGTTVAVTTHLHGFLGLDPGAFLRDVEPVWKLGGRFLWGRRPYFDYGFSQHLNFQHPKLPKAAGFYAYDDMTDYGPHSALMSRNRVFLRDPTGLPIIDGAFAYHLENETFVRWLEKTARDLGVVITDGTVSTIDQREQGLTALHLDDGRVMSADLFIDASGFRSMLMRQTLHEPFIDYKSSLWCDRAVVGGWDREDEPIQPYTILETMDSGWAWRIDHLRRINRGYVYCPAFISDDAAEAEFRIKNPKVGPTRIVPFISGRHERAWVKNVVAIGNAFGFVEPLEATSIGMICHFAQTLAMLLHDGDGVVRDTQRKLYNQLLTQAFDNIRWFLAIHYKFNDRLDTPFWRESREKVNIDGAAHIVEYFQENGPTALLRTPVLDAGDPFGTEGYLAILVGLRVPFHQTYSPGPADLKVWAEYKAAVQQISEQAVGIAEAYEKLKSPQWKWNRNAFLQGPSVINAIR
ncbi:MAG TPA: tryptophan halogenase family protein [Tepidisphaeraceae bacterium]|jgi:tryptophan halogenase|nr:tryptophan halogenase family protein [Tepidisphaeraceae bacterium]